MATGEKMRESSLCDKSKHNKMLETLFLQKKTSKYCDVVMKVCSRQIYAHSNVLAAVSPYFENFLSLDLPRQFSQKSPQVIEIQVDGDESNLLYEDAVENVINFIYTGTISVKEHSVSQIHEISKIMQLDSVVKFCELLLQGKTESNKTYDSEGSLTKQDFSGNTEITAVSFPPVPELWSTWSKNSKDPSSFFFPKTKFKKMISVSVQTTPGDKKSPILRDTDNILPIHEVNVSEANLLNFSNDRKRQIDQAEKCLSELNNSVKKFETSEESPDSKKRRIDFPEEPNKASCDNGNPQRILTRSGRAVVLNKFKNSDIYQILSPAKNKIGNRLDLQSATPSQKTRTIKVTVIRPPLRQPATKISSSENLQNKEGAIEAIEGTSVNESVNTQNNLTPVEAQNAIKAIEGTISNENINTQNNSTFVEAQIVDEEIERAASEKEDILTTEIAVPSLEEPQTLPVSAEPPDTCENMLEIKTDDSLLRSMSEFPSIIKSLEGEEDDENVNNANLNFVSKRRGRPKKMAVKQFLE